MKKVRRDVYGRKYTKFGYYLHTALCVTGATSFLALLGFTAECEQGGSVEAYIVKAGISVIVLVASVLLHNKIFE